MDNNIIVKKSELKDLEDLSQFAYRINSVNEHSSTFCPSKIDAIRNEFEESISVGCLFECRKGSKLVGLFNSYVDHEKSNADCSLLIDTDACYQDTAQKLFNEVKNQFGPSMKYTFFFPKQNTACSTFLSNNGAHREVNEYCLLLKRDKFSYPSHSLTIIDLPKDSYQQLIDLHDNIFPGMYVSGIDIINTLGSKRLVYTLINDGQIIAYSVLKLSGTKRATAEVVAVKEGFRHKGYGRAILAYLANKAFETYEMEYVDLIVDADNENAISLYLDLGFDIESEHCCYTIGF